MNDAARTAELPEPYEVVIVHDAAVGLLEKPGGEAMIVFQAGGRRYCFPLDVAGRDEIARRLLGGRVPTFGPGDMPAKDPSVSARASRRAARGGAAPG